MPRVLDRKDIDVEAVKGKEFENVQKRAEASMWKEERGRDMYVYGSNGVTEKFGVKLQ